MPKKNILFRKGEVYCVKVKQHRIGSNAERIHYFPFDRCYIVHKDDEHLIQRAFRYYLVMDLTDDVSDLLNRLYVNEKKDIPIYRDDDRMKGKVVERHSCFPGLSEEEWLLVVPTHAIPKRRKRGKKGKNDHSELGYLASRMLGSSQNKDVHLPPISVQTPNRRVPMLCSICAKLPNFYEGKCQPGTEACRSSAKTRLPLDQSRVDSEMQSIEEAGDIECP